MLKTPRAQTHTHLANEVLELAVAADTEYLAVGKWFNQLTYSEVLTDFSLIDCVPPVSNSVFRSIVIFKRRAGSSWEEFQRRGNRFSSDYVTIVEHVRQKDATEARGVVNPMAEETLSHVHELVEGSGEVHTSDILRASLVLRKGFVPEGEPAAAHEAERPQPTGKKDIEEMFRMCSTEETLDKALQIAISILKRCQEEASADDLMNWLSGYFTEYPPTDDQVEYVRSMCAHAKLHGQFGIEEYAASTFLMAMFIAQVEHMKKARNTLTARLLHMPVCNLAEVAMSIHQLVVTTLPDLLTEMEAIRTLAVHTIASHGAAKASVSGIKGVSALLSGVGAALVLVLPPVGASLLASSVIASLAAAMVKGKLSASDKKTMELWCASLKKKEEHFQLDFKKIIAHLGMNLETQKVEDGLQTVSPHNVAAAKNEELKNVFSAAMGGLTPDGAALIGHMGTSHLVTAEMVSKTTSGVLGAMTLGAISERISFLGAGAGGAAAVAGAAIAGVGGFISIADFAAHVWTTEPTHAKHKEFLAKLEVVIDTCSKLKDLLKHWRQLPELMCITEVPYAEIFDEQGMVRNVELIGEGGFSYVYRVRSAPSLGDTASAGREGCWAIKVPKKEGRNNNIAEARAISHNELQIAFALGLHENIMECTGYVVCPDIASLCVLMPEACGSLHGALFPEHPTLDQLKPHERLRLLCGACRGLAYLHENNVIHRDVKPANILIGAKMTAKLTDFQGSRHLPEHSTGTQTRTVYTVHCLSSGGYTDPRSVCAGDVSKRVDGYAFGVTTLVTFCGIDAMLYSQGEKKTLASECGLFASHNTTRYNNAMLRIPHEPERWDKVAGRRVPDWCGFDETDACPWPATARTLVAETVFGLTAVESNAVRITIPQAQTMLEQALMYAHQAHSEMLHEVVNQLAEAPQGENETSRLARLRSNVNSILEAFFWPHDIANACAAACAAFTVGSDKRGSACELELAMYVQEVLVVGLQSALDNRAGVMSVVDKLDAVFSLSQPIELHERVIPDQVSLWRDFTRNFQVQLVRWLVLQVCEMPGLLRDAVEVLADKYATIESTDCQPDGQPVYLQMMLEEHAERSIEVLRRMKSKTRPLVLRVRWPDAPPAESHEPKTKDFIYKQGDDLYKDLGMLLLLREMNAIWSANELTFFCKTYDIYPQGSMEKGGIIEMLPNCISLSHPEIGNTKYSKTLHDSFVGAIVGGFILAILHRRSDNMVLVQQEDGSCAICHIDFSHLAGKETSPFDAGPFPIPMWFKDAASSAKKWTRFLDDCEAAYVCLQGKCEQLCHVAMVLTNLLASIDLAEHMRKKFVGITREHIRQLAHAGPDNYNYFIKSTHRRWKLQ